MTGTDSESCEERQESCDQYPEDVGMLYADVQDGIEHACFLFSLMGHKVSHQIIEVGIQAALLGRSGFHEQVW